jgi:hypothetical protein
MVDPIIDTKCLTKVLMDEGSDLNIMYVGTLDAMGISRSRIRPAGAPFHDIVSGKQVMPLGQINLPITFGTPSNYRKRPSLSRWSGSTGPIMPSWDAHVTRSSWSSPTTPI